MRRSSVAKWFVVLAYWTTGCTCPDCTIPGGNMLFSANFNLDVTGGLPDPARMYGPSHAAIIVEGNATIVSSSAVGNKYLRLSRQSTDTRLTTVFGDGDHVKSCDAFYVELRLKGQTVPLYRIASSSFSIEGLNGGKAANLFLYNNMYHYYDFESNVIVAIDGVPYDVSQEHTLRIVVNPSEEKYTVCINNVNILCKTFAPSDFDVRSSFTLNLPATILEGFENTLLIDEVRVVQ